MLDFEDGYSGVYAGDVHEALLLEKMLPKPPDGEPLRFIDFAAPIRDYSGELVGVVGAHIHWRWVTQTVQTAFDQSARDSGAESSAAPSNNWPRPRTASKAETVRRISRRKGN